MPDRTTKVTLTAVVSGYLSGMDQAARKTREFADGSTQKLAAQRQAMTELGTGMLAVGAAIGAGVALAIKEFADFDAKMAQVKTLSHATADEMEGLSQSALHMGQAIGFSATEVADAEIELVKAGVSVKDIMGGALAGSLQLAAAGQIDVAQATEIATIALTQFGLKGKDVPHVADLLAAGADKALGGVADLGEALKSGGLVAAQFGVSLDETIGTLSAFANAGLLGETAGTDLRQMLLKLANPSADASKELKRLGVSIYDTNGQFVGINDLSNQLFDRMHKLTPEVRNAALATIFGSRAIAGANVLYKEGAQGNGIASWTKAVNDSGFAARQAAGKMDNLKGDISKLGAAFNTDLIQAGSGANDALRMVTKGATGLLTVVGGIPAPLLGVGLAIAGVVAGTALLGGSALVIVPKLADMRAAMIALNMTGKSLAANFGKGGLVLAGIALLTTGLAAAGAAAELTNEQLAKLDASTTSKKLQGIDDLFTNTAVFAHSGAEGVDGFKEALNGLYTSNPMQSLQMNKNVGGFIDGITAGIFHLSDDLKRFEAQFKHMGTVLAETAKTDFPAANKQFQEYIKAAGGGKEATRQLLEAMPDYKAELISLASAQGKTLTDTQLLNLAMGKGKLAIDIARESTARQTKALADLSGKAVSATGDITDLASAIKGFGSAQLDVNSAERDFQAAIDDVTDSIKSNGKTLDINTTAGRSNQAALDKIASSALAAASAIVTQTGKQDDATKAVQDGRDALIEALAQYGVTGKAAQDYADSVGLIPGNVVTAVSVTGIETADAAIKGFISRWDGKQVSLPIVLTGDATHNKAMAAFGIQQHAGGGTVYGPGTSKSDDVFMRASVGEEVTQEPWASKFRAQLKQMNQGITPSFSSYTPTPQYMTAPSSSAPSGPMSIEGTLDLGNGLTGFVRGVLTGEVNRAVPAGYGSKR